LEGERVNTTVTIREPVLDDTERLLAFELENRRYFESWINARDDAYYSHDGVLRAIELAAGASRDDLAYQYLAFVGDQLVGRVNLTSIERPHFNKATLGYRIGERFIGRGYGSQAVALVMQEAFDRHALWRVEATARPENIGSARVLDRNAFKIYGRSVRSFCLQGHWHDLLHFERHRTRQQPGIIAGAD